MISASLIDLIDLSDVIWALYSFCLMAMIILLTTKRVRIKFR